MTRHTTWEARNDTVIVTWWEHAYKKAFIINALLNRSYDAFIANKRKDVTSESMGGNVIVVTTQVPLQELIGDIADIENQCLQLVFCKEDIPSLPDNMKELLKESLAIPGKKGR